MLTGTHPFRGTSTLEIQQKKLEGPMPSVAERLKARGIPELDEIVQACLQPQPELRPATIRDVKRMIDRARTRYPKPTFTEAGQFVLPSPVSKKRVQK
jgi:hypothetical protein